jgi:hypothetical protein
VLAGPTPFTGILKPLEAALEDANASLQKVKDAFRGFLVPNLLGRVLSGSKYVVRIVQYLNQLAIITPYAALQLTYENKTDPKRNMNIPCTLHRQADQSSRAALSSSEAVPTARWILSQSVGRIQS